LKRDKTGKMMQSIEDEPRGRRIDGENLRNKLGNN
jgi:hypothetical protein